MKKSLIVIPCFALLIACSSNTGASQAQTPTEPVVGLSGNLPFNVSLEGRFDYPFAIAFLPDDRLLVTEKTGHLMLRAADGSVSEVAGVPNSEMVNQGGLLDVAIAPDYAKSHALYLSYSEPGDGGTSLALARARLDTSSARPRLTDIKLIWHQMPKGEGGQFGGVIGFSPDHEHLFLASGERMRKTPAQDPRTALGKILRFNLDGSVPKDNPMAGAGGAQAITWSTGHRNPYGLAFAADGQLWENEMGPRGGDELNLIEPGRNYGWPNASMGINYDGSNIPDHKPGDGYQAPILCWVPSISPGGAMIYSGTMFPQWDGNYILGALSGKALVRIQLDGKTAKKADQWDMGMRIRDVAQAPDGAIWLIEDGEQGQLMRLTPKT